MNDSSKVDPDVKIPAAVRAAAARSEQLYNELRDKPAGTEDGATGDGATGDGATDEGVTQEVTPDTDAAALVKSDESTPEDGKKPTKKASEKPAEKPGDEETWEHKYKSIYGRYQRSQSELREMTEQVQNLQSLVSTMRQPAEPSKESNPPELDPSSLITPEEAADYGEDFLTVVGKRARQEVAPIVKKYEDEISSLKKQLEGFSGFVQQDAQQKLLSKLDEKLPNWRELNTNQEFLDWLGLPDPYSGAIRHDMLKAAYAQGDSRRVLAFFNGFLAEEAAVAPAGAEPDIEGTRVPKVPLKDLAAPGRAKTAAATSAPAEKPIISRAQVAAFYADVASGKYRGKDEAKDKAEAEIFAAQREGRIR